MSEYQHQKALVLQYYENLEAANAESVEEVISKFNSTDLHWYGVYPFNEQHGVPAVAEAFWKPFLKSWSNVQRRQDIFLAGSNEIDHTDWVISMGPVSYTHLTLPTTPYV